MFDKIFDVFKKVDRTMSTLDSMQRTAERVEYQAKNMSQVSSRGWKWIILIAIVIIAVFYTVFG
ncbi:MAG: hypothetical protein HYT98_00910 [Candidatus Sungbacteria bacterium]|nr:hypothetical protein [Candidatus Sungbacteria bacterium]